MTIRVMAAVVCLLAVCGRAAGPDKKSEDWKARVFTAEELKKYDGTGGTPAYVAVDGVVYDVSGVRPWRGGRHMNMHSAGADLSSDFHSRAPKKIHMGGKVLERLPKVGVVGEKPAIAAKPAVKRAKAEAVKNAPGKEAN